MSVKVTVGQQTFIKKIVLGTPVTTARETLSIDEFTDFDVATKSDGQILVYDSSEGAFKKPSASYPVYLCLVKFRVIDPGFGFGKTPQQNMQLVKYNKRLLSGEYPILIGVSRKSTLGYYLKEKDPNNRKIASILLSALGVYEGANIVRVHDVAEMKEGVLILEALRNEQV